MKDSFTAVQLDIFYALCYAAKMEVVPVIRPPSKIVRDALSHQESLHTHFVGTKILEGFVDDDHEITSKLSCAILRVR